MARIYRHYGAEKYDPREVNPIRNRQGWNKPWGGLWASYTKALKPWSVWCKKENFHTGDLNKFFEFTLKDNARVLRIEDQEQLDKFLADVTYSYYVTMGDLGNTWLGPKKVPIINYEAIGEEFDAIEIMAGSCDYLYEAFYGWDCDSILILNKDIIIPIQ